MLFFVVQYIFLSEFLPAGKSIPASIYIPYAAHIYLFFRDIRIQSFKPILVRTGYMSGLECGIESLYTVHSFTLWIEIL
jgi:hypothetical protein